MNHPIIVWCVLVVVRFAEIGKEKDIFYLPGDIDENDDCDDL